MAQSEKVTHVSILGNKQPNVIECVDLTATCSTSTAVVLQSRVLIYRVENTLRKSCIITLFHCAAIALVIDIALYCNTSVM